MADPETYCRHLLKDPIVMFVSRTFLLWVALSLLIPFAIGGWSGLLWGGLVRIFLAHHVTWSVNSVCHTFGKREFETNDQSRNEWLIGLLAMGEGWHNNHHAFPRSAFHGLHWWQFDLSGYLIWTLERIGLVSDVYRVSPEQLARRSTRAVKKEAVQAEQAALVKAEPPVVPVALD
jgi:stearoyl-CoA desaturase (delta-9 desaturase)